MEARQKRSASKTERGSPQVAPTVAARAAKPVMDAVRSVMRPLARLLLRNGVAFSAFVDVAKEVFVDVAHRELTLPGRKPSISRTSVVTGLTRKDVSRMLARSVDETEARASKYNRAARVLTGWATDSRFLDDTGAPRPLRFDEGEPNFADLVRAFSGDMPSRAVLDELLRMGAVSRADDGRILLDRSGFVPQADDEQKLYILGTDVADLISCIDHNILEPETAFFQRKVAYDNLVSEALPGLKELLATRGQALLEDLNQSMAPFDRDANPDVTGTGKRRAMIGIYYYEEAGDEES